MSVKLKELEQHLKLTSFVGLGVGEGVGIGVLDECKQRGRLYT